MVAIDRLPRSAIDGLWVAIGRAFSFSLVPGGLILQGLGYQDNDGGRPPPPLQSVGFRDSPGYTVKEMGHS